MMKRIGRYLCVSALLGALLACAGCSGNGTTATPQPAGATGTIEGTAK